MSIKRTTASEEKIGSESSPCVANSSRKVGLMSLTECPACGSPSLEQNQTVYKLDFDEQEGETLAVNFWICVGCSRAFFEMPGKNSAANE
jgi:hypothetical protein